MTDHELRMMMLDIDGILTRHEATTADGLAAAQQMAVAPAAPRAPISLHCPHYLIKSPRWKRYPPGAFSFCAPCQLLGWKPCS